MAGIVHTVLRLLLFSVIGAGVSGDGGLLFAEQGYEITFPCEEDVVCFHIWQLSTSETSDYIAMVGNGEIQTAVREHADSKCSLQIKDLTADDVGRHRCQQRPGVFSPPKTSPEFILMPGKTVSLQCILLTYVEQGDCNTPLQHVSLTWVNENGAEIQDDSQHHIKLESYCDITLTVTFQSAENKKFRCQARVDEQVQTSVELLVRVPALKGRGRGLVFELEPKNQGSNQDVIGAAVGVVGCVVLTALVSVFLVNKRRTRNQLAGESCHTISTNNVRNADDVIYADIVLPAGPDSTWVHECDSTEYACIR